MSPASIARLLLLGALWGASHLFTRMAVPHLGPTALISLRLVLGALTLSVFAQLWLGQRDSLASFRQHYRYLTVLGILNCALPFILIAHAAQSLSASLTSILNATAPIWGALFTAISLRHLPSRSVCFGLFLGLLGVAIIVGLDPATLGEARGQAITEMLAATLCYGLASQLIRRAPAGLAPVTLAGHSMWFALIFVAPFLFAFPATAAPPKEIIWAVLGLGILSTGLAYALYFRLIQDNGASSALTVTFLIPVFGVLWGHLFLGEALSLQTLVGAAIVLLGTALSTGTLGLRVNLYTNIK